MEEDFYRELCEETPNNRANIKYAYIKEVACSLKKLTSMELFMGLYLADRCSLISEVKSLSEEEINNIVDKCYKPYSESLDSLINPKWVLQEDSSNELGAYKVRGIAKDSRKYEIRGSVDSLDTIESLLRHIEYLGNVGVSRNLLINIDGDELGRLKVFRSDGHRIDYKKYNVEEETIETKISGKYNI